MYWIWTGVLIGQFTYVLCWAIQHLPLNANNRKTAGAIHSTKISGNFGLKLNGSFQCNPKSFEKSVHLSSWTTFLGWTGPIEMDRSIWRNISNTSDSVSSGYPNTEKRVENTTRSRVFLWRIFVWRCLNSR